MMSEQLLPDFSGEPSSAASTDPTTDTQIDAVAKGEMSPMQVDANESTVLDTHTTGKPEALDAQDNAHVDIADVVPIDDMFYTLEHDADLLASMADADAYSGAHELHRNDKGSSDMRTRIGGLIGSSSSGLSFSGIFGHEGGDAYGGAGSMRGGRLLSGEDSGNLGGAMESDNPKQDVNEIHASLKHMFKIIRESAEPSQLKALKKLLVEVRPSRSKWANEDRVGQEALYEALEKVLNDLKNYTEHSIPFLKPVQKREAPNYHDIIKHPMDLGTMTKKLKSLQYNSKDDFVRDLNLIWANCMSYNTIPDSIYRRHASAMKRKSAEMLKRVPDIRIKNIGAEESETDDDAENKTEGRDRHRAGSVAASVDTPSQSHQSQFDIIKREPDGVDDGTASSTQAESHTGALLNQDIRGIASPSIDSSAESVDLRRTSIASATAQQSTDPQRQLIHDDEVTSTQQNQQILDDVDDEPPLYSILWDQATLDWRRNALRQREEQMALPFSDRLAYVRTEHGMSEYLSARSRFLDRMHARRKRLSLSEKTVLNVDMDSFRDELIKRQSQKHDRRPDTVDGIPAASTPSRQNRTHNLTPTDADQGGLGETIKTLADGIGSSHVDVNSQALLDVGETHVPNKVANGGDDGDDVCRKDDNGNVAGEAGDNTAPVDTAASADLDAHIARLYSSAFLPELHYSVACIPELYSPPAPLSLDLYRFLDDPTTLSGIVEETGVFIDHPRIPPAPLPTMSEYDQLLPNPQSALYIHMLANISELHQIKATFGKILSTQYQLSDTAASAAPGSGSGVAAVTTTGAAIHTSSSVSASPVAAATTATTSTGASLPSFTRDIYKPLWPRESLPPLTINFESGMAVMRQTCTFMLAHCGFDGTTENTLATLTEVAMDYIMNLGRTLQAYYTRFGDSMTAEEILLAVLELNGVQDPNQLDVYIRHDVVRSGTQLRDLRRKLQAAHIDLERTLNRTDPLHGDAAKEDVEIDESRDQIMSGNFFQDMGVDFLGLKDFGIDITSIPVELWNRKADRPIRARVNRSILGNALGIDTSGEDGGVVVPGASVGGPHTCDLPPWPPVNPHLQIGLLKPFYDKKKMGIDDLAADETRPRTKDEKQMLKLAQQVRKRPVTGTGGAFSGGAVAAGGRGGFTPHPTASAAVSTTATPIIPTLHINSVGSATSTSGGQPPSTETSTKRKRKTTGSGGSLSFSAQPTSLSQDATGSGSSTPARTKGSTLSTTAASQSNVSGPVQQTAAASGTGASTTTPTITPVATPTTTTKPLRGSQRKSGVRKNRKSTLATSSAVPSSDAGESPA